MLSDGPHAQALAPEGLCLRLLGVRSFKVGFPVYRTGGASAAFLALPVPFRGLALADDGFKLTLFVGGDPEQVDKRIVSRRVEWCVVLTTEANLSPAS